MKIGEILKVTQPTEYQKLYSMFSKKKKRNPYKSTNENLSHRDFQNMMKHATYRRGRGGALRQVT